MSLDQALAVTRTGDAWVFRGTSAADRAIQFGTNSPVNHVGMTLTIEDLPPLMWHAELGRSLVDMWTGTHQRGAQLHDLRDAVLVWGRRYGQECWLRQLDPVATPEMEDAALRTVARLDGTPFPSSAAMVTRWLRGRVPLGRRARERDLETTYCAEVMGLTYEAMGLLPRGHRPGYYAPGRFWSGATLRLTGGATLGGEIRVILPES
ncbi:hypothetical protein KIK06_06075 [Nocardiopsis sp. EMB25]|uniref:hypothetical protein n=1 Tax=Nocardiopsis sp. EMB25 TaxID=2835867 RepID=UPI002283B9FA|nr:hypothetical protein [Nocardiopsis sp. EMB25]MCY9783462.1 hypothetical protein [Nocardiopsis sp. EMB25]